jgi:hypothetical protein
VCLHCLDQQSRPLSFFYSPLLHHSVCGSLIMPNNNNNNNNTNHEEPSAFAKFASSMGLCCFKVKEQGHIAVLEQKVTARKKKFGVDYATLMQNGASPATLNSCKKEAMDEIEALERQIDDHHESIAQKEQENGVVSNRPSSTTTTQSPSSGSGNNNNNNNTKPRPSNTGTAASNNRDAPPGRPSHSPSRGGGGGGGKPAGGRGGGGGGRGGGGNNNNNNNKPKPATASGGGGGNNNKKPAAAGGGGRGGTGGRGGGAGGRGGGTGGGTGGGGGPKPPQDDDQFASANPRKWKLTDQKYSGSVSYDTIGKQEEIKAQSITKGIEQFKSNPKKYTAMMYQTAMLDWPTDQQKYTYIHRAGTKGYTPKNVNASSGWMTILMHHYEALPPFPKNILPAAACDKYTDAMTHQKRKLHSSSNLPILPGRGMGVCDSPNIKLIGDIDPSDIKQGSVGDCWLLSGISSLAEFDGAVKRLFRKTRDLDRRPLDGPNMYTVTLWDLTTWKEVDIHIDERLAVTADGRGTLLASKPSDDGELWVCYLEKALAAHCGGWDKITGGQCTHAWALMTGCKEQYSISKNPKTGKYICSAKYNPYDKKWAKHGNSPHDGDASMWRVAWPKVGGGGDMNLELTEEELFQKMYAWDQENYIVGAGTSGTSDTQSTGGMVDNHAYSVIECRDNVAGTSIDLFKVRNPWGKGEIEDGEFDDDGPGWNRYPQIKKELNPVMADDGIFWVTKKEFFQFFKTIYVSASNMTAFLED